MMGTLLAGGAAFNINTLTPLDIILLIVLLYSVIRGFFTGAISELGLFLALVVGTLIAGRLAPSVGAPLVSLGLARSVCYALGYAIVLAVIWIAARVVTRILRRGARLLMLGMIDRLGGAVFGLLRGLLVVVVVGFLVVHFRVEPLNAQAHTSPLVKAASPIFPALDTLLPPGLR